MKRVTKLCIILFALLVVLMISMNLKYYFKGNLFMWGNLIFAEVGCLFLLITEIIAEKIK